MRFQTRETYISPEGQCGKVSREIEIRHRNFWKAGEEERRRRRSEMLIERIGPGRPVYDSGMTLVEPRERGGAAQMHCGGQRRLSAEGEIHDAAFLASSKLKISRALCVDTVGIARKNPVSSLRR